MSLSFCLLDVVPMPRTMQAAKRSVSRNPARSPPFSPTEIKTPSFALRVIQSSDSDEDNDNIPPFEAVSRNLIKIGALTIDDFLQSPTEIDDFDVPHHVHENRETSPTPPPPPTESKQPIKSDSHSKMQCVAQLHHTCQRVFGKTDTLKFEFIEVDGPNTKRCILTITRPNGARRSYQTPGVYSRKNEAKSQTAALAVEMGAIDFIATGDTDPPKAKKGLVLAPLDAAGEDDSIAPEPEDPGVQEIEDCCVEWRAGRVKPYWVALNEPKFGTKQGCALRIELSPHSIRVYSSDVKYDTITEARAACAKVALDQGVVEFVKHGNGQVGPEKPPTVVPDADADAQEAETKAKYTPPTPLTLQVFYETFPQPFPENFGDRSAVEINAPSWLNTTIQGARGGKLSTNFIWTTNGTLWGGNLGLHGCLLRIERPQQSRSYLVDARFPKRADAKAAVCLQAISQGVGDYIRAVGKEVEEKITPIMRRWANDLIFPLLGSECSKVKPGTHPRYDFQKEKDAYGCTMTLELSSFPTADETTTFTAPPDYRTKVDAKIAVACLAAEQGAIEFLRFRGGPPPPGYQTFYSTLIDGTAVAPNKRKARDDDAPQERKKSKIDMKEGDRHVPLLETKDEAMARLSGGRSSRPHQSRDHRSGNNGGWKNPHGPASSGLGAIARPAQRPPIGQFRPGSRAVDDSTLTYEVTESKAPAAPMAISRPMPQVPAVPPGPSRTGPVMLGIPANCASFTPASHGRFGQGGSQVAPPQLSAFAPRPPPQPFPQAGQHLPGGFPHVSPMAEYYPPGNNMPPVIPPYTLSQQYPGAATGPSPSLVPPPPPCYPPPYTNPASPAPPYGPYSSVQSFQPPHFPPPPPPSAPPHIYYPQHQQSHSPYPNISAPGVPTAPTANTGTNWAPSYGIPSAPIVSGRPLYNLDTHQPSHNPQSPRTFASVQVNKSAEERTIIKNSQPTSQLKSQTYDLKTSDEDIQLTVTPAPVAKSHVASLLDYCTKAGVSQPQFHQQAVTGNVGKTMHKVWIVMGNEKLELPVTFATVSEGRERVAKQVLGRLRSREKKDDLL